MCAVDGVRISSCESTGCDSRRIVGACASATGVTGVAGVAATNAESGVKPPVSEMAAGSVVAAAAVVVVGVSVKAAADDDAVRPAVG